MREAVSVIFTYKDELFSIKRQNYLKVFPGYTAFPGGKVDKADHDGLESFISYSSIFSGDLHLLQALSRECEEELNFCLLKAIDENKVISITDLGIATTPEFNPYRFKTYFYRVELSEKVDFDVDSGEAKEAGWSEASHLLSSFKEGKILAVPPTVKLINALGDNIKCVGRLSLDLDYDPKTDVPMIESICGVRQFLPLSKTFPPANRTNSFIIGDEIKERILIDPSPIDESELEKFCHSVSKIGFSKIFITHHHPDHHEFAPKIAIKYNVPIILGLDTKDRIESKWGSDYFDGISLEIVKEGDIVTKSLGRDIYVYEVPGHDEGQLALAPKTMEWFLVGDLIQTVGTVVIGAPEGDMAKYFTTLKRVIDLKPNIIMPSHGIAIGGVHKLKATLKHRMLREEQIQDLFDDGKSESEILAVVYAGLDERLHKYAMKTIRAHKIKLGLPLE